MNIRIIFGGIAFQGYKLTCQITKRTPEAKIGEAEELKGTRNIQWY